MAVNGIYNNSSIYQSSLNLYQITTARSTANTVNAVQKVTGVTSSTSSGTVSYYASSTDTFLRTYESELTSLEAAASKLSLSNSSNVFTNYEAGSSDEKVAAVSSSSRLETAIDLELNVQSVAQGQKNVSASHYAFERVAEDADMNFTIQGAAGKTKTISVSSTDANGEARGYKDMYQEAAAKINAESSSLGVKASVETKEGKVSLVLTAKNTGEQNGFTLSGSTGAADGLDQTLVKAQDAVYTLTQDGESKTYQSAGNTFTLDSGKVKVTIKDTGKTELYTGVDEDEIVSAVKDLVNSYNSVTNLLENNSSRGKGAASQLAAFNRGMADEKTLSKLGITYDKNGDLTLDEDKLKEALEENFETTANLIGGQFGIAERALSKADKALSDSVQHIVSNDLSSSSSDFSWNSESSSSSSYSLMNQFVRGGAYNLSNLYTVGMLLNTLA